MDQHDRKYPAIQDAVMHAGKLWQTLDKDKIRQEIREEKEKVYQRHEDSKQRKRDTHNRPRHQLEEQQNSQRGSRRNQASERDRKPKDSKPRLSEEEQQHCKEKNLCFNCGYPGHSSRDCSYPFNPN